LKKSKQVPKSEVKGINKHDVFRCLVDDGDFKRDELMFYTGKSFNRFGNEYYQVVWENGDSDYCTLAELNVDPVTIRPYNPEQDPDFYFYLG
jgi:hypothetical protein